MIKINEIKRKKWWILSAILIGLLVGGYIIFAAGFSIDSTRTPNNLHVWRPSVLPNGLSISKEQYERKVLPAQGTEYFEYAFTLSNGFTIFERTHSKGLPGTIPCAQWGGETECREYTTKDGLVYHVVVAKYKSMPFDLTIEASDETTDFYFLIPEVGIKNYLSYDWSLMMNSLKPVDISHKHPTTSTVRCCGG